MSEFGGLRKHERPSMHLKYVNNNIGQILDQWSLTDEKRGKKAEEPVNQQNGSDKKA